MVHPLSALKESSARLSRIAAETTLSLPLLTRPSHSSTLLLLGLKLVPHRASDEATELDSPIEALGLLVHAIHTQVGFRLVQPAPAPNGEGAEANQLPSGWSSNGSPKFRYKHEQSSLEFVVTITELGGRAMIAAVAVQNPKSVSFDLLLTDYFSHSTFPLKVSSSGSALDLEAAFSSPARLTDLITLYRLNILQPLIPGLRKDGYTELPASATPNASSSSGAGARVGSPQGPYYPDSDGPLMGVPGRGGGMAFPPSRGGGGGDDPLRIPGSGGRGVGAPNPHDIGRSDLLPLGGMGGTFGSAGPGSNPFGGGLGGAIGGGGMMMGRDEFRNRFGGGDGTVGGRGPWGGDGYLPPMGAPPGARFDPVGPSGGSGPPQPGGTGIGGFGGGQGIGSFPGARGGGGRAPQRSGDPDWDGDRPPGSSGNDYDAMFG